MLPPSGEEQTHVDKNTTKAENNEEKTKFPCGVPLWVCTLVSYEGEKQGGADIKKRDEGQKKDSGWQSVGGRREVKKTRKRNEGNGDCQWGLGLN